MLTDELVGKKLKSDLLGFLEIANNASLNDMIRNPQNHLEIVMDFFSKLQEMAHASSLKLPIPDTLCLCEGKTVHVFSDTGNEAVRFREGPSALNSFVQRLEEHATEQQLSERLPIALVLDEVGGHKLCLALSEVRKRWQEARSQHKLMQQFITPKAKEIIKYRVLWVKDRQPLVFIITKSGAEATVVKHADERRYLHDINVFSYAGRLFRSSFSPFFPFSSNLQENLLEKQSSITPKSRSQKQLLIGTRPRSKFSLVKSAKRVPQIDSMASVICDILRSKVVHSQDDIRVLIFDVSQGHDNVFRLLNVKGLLCASKDVPLSLTMPKMTGSSAQKNYERLNKTQHLSKSQELLKSLHRESKSMVFSKRCPYVDLKEAHERKVSVYSLLPHASDSQCAAPPKPKSRLRVYCSELLAETADLYDSMRRRSSEKHLVPADDLNFAKFPPFLDTLMDKFFTRLQESPLAFYFKNKEVFLAKPGLVKAICGKEGYTFRFKLKHIHAGMSITPKEFDAFLTTLTQQLHEDGVPEADIAYVHARLARYKSEVVDSGTSDASKPSKQH